jgi:hypothetical protein
MKRAKNLVSVNLFLEWLLEWSPSHFESHGNCVHSAPNFQSVHFTNGLWLRMSIKDQFLELAR